MGKEFNMFKSYIVQKSSKYRGLWEIQLNEHEDASYIFPSVLDKLDDFLESNHLDNTWALIWYITEPYDELQDVETKELAEQRASKFISPEKCLTWLSENHVLKLLEEQQPEGYEEMIQQLQVLERYWKQGFYVYSWG